MNSRRRLLVVITGTVLFLILAIGSGWTYAQFGLQPIMEPLAYQVNNTGRWLKNFILAQHLQAENQQLLSKLAELNSKPVECVDLSLENKRLRDLSLVPLPSGYIRVGAEVIGQQLDDSGTTYLINRGQDDGLVPGLAVISGLSAEQGRPRGVLVGSVKSVSAKTASIALITASSSRVVAEVVNEQHSQGLAQGEYNLAVRLRYVSQTDDLVTGQNVVTSNLDNLIPPGLLIGTISGVVQSEADFYKSALVVTPLPLERIQFLDVLIRQ